MSDRPFSPGHLTSSVLNRWSEQLSDNKGDRAELRRCETVFEIVTTPAYHRIYRQLIDAGLPTEGSSGQRGARLPAIVGLIAHLKDSPAMPEPLAEVMSASTKDSDRPKVSPNRFRALLQLEAPDALLGGFRRVLPLIEKEVGPSALAHDLYFWDEDVKRRWAYAYRWPAKTVD